MLRVGRIQITEQVSFFQMQRHDAMRILPALNRLTVAGREVRVVTEDDSRPAPRGERPERSDRPDRRERRR
jgi:hypothetical protein